MSVLFDQLRISDDGKKMYINIHVNRAQDFDDVYLDEITIKLPEKISETSPNLPSSEHIFYKKFEGNQKEADFVLCPTDMDENFTKSNFSEDLFFVYITIKGVPGECTPCTLDEPTLGVTFDTKLLYQKVMNYTRMLADDCNIPVDFADFILLWNAFKASIETDHYLPAIKYWTLLFGGTGQEGVYGFNGYEGSKKCGCHG